MRILFIAFMLLSVAVQAQTNGGELSGRTASGGRLPVGVDSLKPLRGALMVSDSTLKVKIDSLNRVGFRLRSTDSANLANAAAFVYDWNTTGTSRRGGYIFGMAEATPFSRTDGRMSPMSFDLRGNLRVTQSAAGKVDLYAPSRTADIGNYVEASIDTFGNTRVHDSINWWQLEHLNTNSDAEVGELYATIIPALTDIDSNTFDIKDSLSLIRSQLRSELVSINNNTNTVMGYQDDIPLMRDTIGKIYNRIPSGLTVNSNRLAIYSPDSLRVFATNGFGSSGGTSLDAVDSTNLAKAADSTYASRKGVVLLANPTITNDSTTMSRTTVKISSMPAVTVDSATGSRKAVVLLSDATKSYNTGATDATTQRVALVNEQGQDLIVTGQAGQTASGNNVILAVAGTSSYDTWQTGTTYRSVAFQIITTGTISGGTITYEQSNDNVSFTSMFLADLSNLSSYATAYTLASNTNRYFVGNISMRYIRARISTGVTGGGTVQCITALSIIPRQNVVTQVGNSLSALVSFLNGNTNMGKSEDGAAGDGFVGIGAIAVRQDTLATTTNANADNTWINTDKTGSQIIVDQRQHRRTYNCAFTVAPAASATDIVEIVGSSSKTVLIHSITISGTQTTGGGVPVYIIKRSTAATGGTSSSPTIVPRSTVLGEGAAATAVVKAYTVNPTTGTSVGNIWLGNVSTPATTGDTQPYTITFNQTGMPVKLSGTSQTLCINLNGATVTGGLFYITIEFSETGE